MSSCLLNLLPVEVLYMIFEYFWAQEILYSFWNVNKYINQVLNKYNGYLLNFKSIHKRHFDLICRSIKPCQIASLTLSDSHDTIGQSQLFLSLFSVDQLIHLRALTLIDIDRDSISAFSDVHKLQCLVSIEIDADSRISLDPIASQLKRFIVNPCSDDYSNHGMLLPLIQLPRLRYLSLGRCSFARLYSILGFALNLISLHVTIIYWSSTEMNQLIANDQRSSFRLVHLYMSMEVKDSIQRFLLRMPSLRQIELIVTCGGGDKSLWDGYQWEVFIGNHLALLTKFDFKFASRWFQIDDGYEERVLAPFRSSFWVGAERQWFVTYDHSSRILFSVPRFAPTICSDSWMPVLPHTTTLPVEQHAIFYDHITELNLDYGKISSYRYQYVKKLSLSTPNFDQQLLDLSKVEFLTVKTTGWTLEVLVELISQSMSTLSHLVITSCFSSRNSDRINAMPLVNIRTLNLSNYSSCSSDEKLRWTELFPCIERLIIHVNTCRQMAIFIDRFERLSSASFFVVNCQISTIERLREPRVTREWFVDNTHRLSINSNFICRIEYQYQSWIHLWIGEREHQLNKTREKGWLRKCFPRFALK